MDQSALPWTTGVETPWHVHTKGALLASATTGTDRDIIALRERSQTEEATKRVTALTRGMENGQLQANKRSWTPTAVPWLPEGKGGGGWRRVKGVKDMVTEGARLGAEHTVQTHDVHWEPMQFC